MDKIALKLKRRVRRKKSIRKKVFGTAEKPRLSVYKSNRYIYIQAIDDTKGNTIASMSSLKINNCVNKDTCAKIGAEFAKKLKAKKIDTAVFDRNGFLYTGRVKVLGDTIRENGIKI